MMWTRRFLLSLALLNLIAADRSPTFWSQPGPPTTEDKSNGAKTRCDYIVGLPVVMKSGGNGRICTWLECEESVTITVTLKYYSEEISIVNQVNVKEYCNCDSFPVPQAKSAETVLVDIIITGPTVDISERRSAAIDAPLSSCLFDYDIPVYRQGETIHTRIICFDEHLLPVNKNFVTISFVDPNGAIIIQIKNPPAEGGIVSLTIPISQYARPGWYSLRAEDAAGNIQYGGVEIQRYTLPRYSWTVSVPNTVSVLDMTAEIGGTAQYTYGEPVPGEVVVKCCRRTIRYGSQGNCYRGIKDICINFTKKLDEHGNFTAILDLDTFKLPYTVYENSICCDVAMKESGTGILDLQSSCMYISDRLANLQLDYDTMGMYYNVIDVPFAVILTDEKGKPLPHKEIRVNINGIHIRDVITDSSGRAETTLDTSSHLAENITISASFNDPNLCYRPGYYSDRSFPYVEITLYRRYSKSGSQIRIKPIKGQLSCNEDIVIDVQYKLKDQGLKKNAVKVPLIYMIIARTEIVGYGKIIIDVTKRRSGTACIKFHVDASVATGADILVMIPLTDDIISDTRSMSVDSCFKNLVNLTFSADVVEPGAMIGRTVTAEPLSVCALKVTDSAFSILGYSDGFSPYSVYSAVTTYLYNLNYQNYNFESTEPACIDPNSLQFCNGEYLRPTSCRTDGDSYMNFQRAHFIMQSNLQTKRYKVCGMENEDYFSTTPVMFMAEATSASMFKGIGASAGNSINTVRKNFASAFGFHVVSVGLDGKTNITSKIPDSITKWNGNAICMSNKTGIGMTTKPAEFTAKLDFFGELSIPSSCIRGEELYVVLTAANYLDYCVWVVPGFEPSGDYDYTFVGDAGKRCICSQERVSWTIIIIAKKIGQITIFSYAQTTKLSATCDGPNDDSLPSRRDTTRISLFVEPEGIPKEITRSVLVRATGSTTSITVTILEPSNLVPDSSRFTVTVMGNPVSLAIKNFNKVLSMPADCCEQQASKLLIIVRLLKHAKTRGMLDDDLKKRMLAEIAELLMDQIGCRTYSGSYCLYRSTCIINDWVTLYSVEALFWVSEFMFVDLSIQVSALTYMASHQDPETGCFNPDGRNLIYQMKDNSVNQFTAFAIPVLSAFSQNYSSAEPMLNGAQKCFQNMDFDKQDTLTQCYMLNAAAALKQWNTFLSMYSSLIGKVQTSEDGALFWDDKYWPNYFPVRSGSLYITACMVTAMTKFPNPPQDMINKMAAALKWLAQQMNMNGGFYSSQASARVIEAMIRFDQQYGSSVEDVQVVVLKGNSEVYRTNVNSGNEATVQSLEVPADYGTYTITVTGTGVAFVQVSANYYVKIMDDNDSKFKITVDTSSPKCLEGIANQIDVNISISYHGERNETGMTLLQVGTLTGYDINTFSIWQLVGEGKPLCDFRMDGNTAVLYIDKVSDVPVFVPVSMNIRHRVGVMQPSKVTVEEFQTGENGARKYQKPCSVQPVVNA